jgi:uncharacterized protein (DUF1810 family)
MSDPTLDRFIAAQDAIWPEPLDELRAGRKASHWMWFVFPQIAGLGHSAMAQRYAIADLAEARAYLAEPTLRVRLEQSADAVLAWAGKRSAEAIMGGIDAIKLRSSATLFEAAGDDDRFARLLQAFYDGRRDPATLAEIGRN